MSKKYNQIIDQYVEYISTRVIQEYGGSYQNFQTMGKTWRKDIPYNSIAEDFILHQTDLFLILLNNRDRVDFNLMYKVCGGISQYLALYLGKKSLPSSKNNVSKEVLNTVSQDVLNKIFLNSRYFVPKFNQRYKKPIDETDTRFTECNPGVMAMLHAQRQK